MPDGTLPTRRPPARPRASGSDHSSAARRRSYRVIAFDWDGTAVAGRGDDATRVSGLLRRLIRAGVRLAIVTGTNLANIDQQFARGRHDPRLPGLFVLANRGSEVYTYDPDGRPVLVARRTASGDEDAALTKAADDLQLALRERHGLETRIVYDRLNRRKVDLIPLPEWADPPKDRIGDLEEATLARLWSHGLRDGVRSVARLAKEIARSHGLADPRLTTDAKYLEIGLTDKSDSLDWVMKRLVEPAGLTGADLLVLGDEYGTVAGLPGSDSLMIVPAAARATFVTVGPEPHGAPRGVLLAPGGPAAFADILSEQVSVAEDRLSNGWGSTLLRGEVVVVTLSVADGILPTGDPTWRIVADGFQPAREHDIESILAVSNGYIGTRGALAEDGIVSNPGTYLAGVYDRAPGSIAEIVEAPDWAKLDIQVDGEALRLETGGVFEHRRILHMRQGLFERRWRHRDPKGRITSLRYLRLASLADRQALAETVEITPENYGGQIIATASLEPGEGGVGPLRDVVINGGQPTDRGICLANGAEPMTLVGRTQGSDVLVAFAASTRLRGVAADECACCRLVEAGGVGERWTWEADIGASYRLEKLTAVCTSREHGDPLGAARDRAFRLAKEPLERFLTAHTEAWSERWTASDVVVDGDPLLQRGLRFALYHLNSAANPADDRSSIGARALTGDAYLGHVFWDAEMYVLPFYLYSQPDAARRMLLYRYHTLPAAREKAKFWGYRGALYAWESADTGAEESPSVVVSPEGTVLPVLTGAMEHHISADVAYAVWHYYQVTRDDQFLRDRGAEMLLETARFWASRGAVGEDGRYHIVRIIGPDEYHHDVADNAYTNGMAAWNLARAVDAARILTTRWPDVWRSLSARLDLTEDELANWSEIAARMHFAHSSSGVTEQFAGYFGLEDVDLSQFEPILTPLDLLLGRERIAASQVIKQPDVVMRDYLLWDETPPERREANFRYYIRRCSNGSSLSPAIQAAVAARLGDRVIAERQLDIADDIDLADSYGNAAGGIHVGALGGLWQAIVCGFGGVRSSESALVLDPWLMPTWERLAFPLLWRGTRLRVEVRPEPLRATVEHVSGPMAMVRIGGPDGSEIILADGRRHVSLCGDGGWGPWKEEAD